MPTIEIEVKNKIARQTNKEVYVCGNSDFTVVFSFDAEWDAYPAKTAHLKYNGKHQDIVFMGNECPVPVISNINNFQIGVYAGDLHTTTAAVVMARKSVLCGDSVPDAPAPDVYHQIMEVIVPEAVSMAEAAAAEALRHQNNAMIYANDAQRAANTANSAALDARTHANNANASEDNAAESASKAATSENNAAASASKAATNADNAEKYCDSARDDANRAKKIADSVGRATGLQADLNVNDPAAVGYVMNRTHWAELVVEKENLPETEAVRLSATSTDFDLNVNLGLVPEETYVVTYNGVDYVVDCLLLRNSDFSVHTHMLGRWIGVDDETPFRITTDSYYTANNQPTGAMSYVRAFDGAEKVVISVKQVQEIVHPIPAKFLRLTAPDGTVYELGVANDGTVKTTKVTE